MDRDPARPDAGGDRGEAAGAPRAPLPGGPRPAPHARRARRAAGAEPLRRLARPRGGPLQDVLPAGLGNPQHHRDPAPARGPSARLRPRREDVVEVLSEQGLLPAIYFVFSRAGCDRSVQCVLEAGLRLTTSEEATAIRSFAEMRVAWMDEEDLKTLGFYDFEEALAAGIAAHHAGMLPVFKETVEELFEAGLVKVVFATETLSLGINMPARSVVIEDLWKFQGERHEILTPGEYTQLTGRAGRRGIDELGHAVVVYQRQVPFERVASLASTRTYELTSSFRPSYNMAVNLVRNYTRDEAHHLLNSSFAQFLADRGVVALERQLERDRAQLGGFRKQMRCDRGDFAEYWALREKAQEIRETFREGARRGPDRCGSRGPRGAAAGRRDLRAPRPAAGPGRRRVEPRGPPDRPRTGPVVLPAVVAGLPGSAGLAHAGAAAALGERSERPVPSRPGRAAGGPGRAPSRTAAGRRRPPCRTRGRPVRPRSRDPPVPRLPRPHGPRAVGDPRRPGRPPDPRSRAPVRTRTETLARQFERVVAVLEELGYVQGFDIMPKGLTLARSTARATSWWPRPWPRACSRGSSRRRWPRSSRRSCSSRGSDPRSGEMPTPAAAERYRRLQHIWRTVRAAEDRHQVQLCRELEDGFAGSLYRWAKGEPLEDVLRESGDVARRLRPQRARQRARPASPDRAGRAGALGRGRPARARGGQPGGRRVHGGLTGRL